MQDFAKEFKQDMIAFQAITKQFYHKELSVADYKRVSGAFGSYAQRGGEFGMLRLRLWGGRITKKHLQFIMDCIQKYQIGLLHLTTCQTVQFHNLKPDDICHLVEEAWANGIITMGGGGDYPRNVMMSPLSGVDPNEYFDVTGYAKAASDYVIGLLRKVKLPRKLKICFSNTPSDVTHATFRDLGFAANKDGTFDVYSAGGMGREPKMGVLVAEHIMPDMTLYYIKAMIDVFLTHGDYKNRMKSRTRFMQDTLGIENYKKAFNEKLNEALNTENLKQTVRPYTVQKQSDGTITNKRAIPQKQNGLYAVSIHPIGGTIDPETFSSLYQAILPMEETEIRLSPDEGMYVINCTAKEAQRLIELTDAAAKTTFETSIACIGNRICQLGLRDSQTLLKTCIKAIRPYQFADGALPKIHISGCPSSCGTHQAATLGFRGAVKQTPNGPLPALALYEGGCSERGKASFGTEICIITEENIPKFLIELGQLTTKAQKNYTEWIKENHKTFLNLAEKYANLPQ